MNLCHTLYITQWSTLISVEPYYYIWCVSVSCTCVLQTFSHMCLLFWLSLILLYTASRRGERPSPLTCPTFLYSRTDTAILLQETTASQRVIQRTSWREDPERRCVCVCVSCVDVTRVVPRALPVVQLTSEVVTCL